MIQVALTRLELARERMSEAAKVLKNVFGNAKDHRYMVETLAGFWDDILKSRRRSFLTHALTSESLKRHNYDWLNVRFWMRDGWRSMLSHRARQITFVSKEESPENMSLVIKSWWSLIDAVKLIERDAHTLHLVLKASCNIRKRGSIDVKARAIKALVSEGLSKIRYTDFRRRLDGPECIKPNASRGLSS